MALIEIDLRPDRATLKTFGWIACGAFAVLAALAWLGWVVFALVPEAARPETAAGLLAVGALAGALSVIRPEWNRPLYVGLTLVALPIGFVLSYVIMGLLFYAVITPVGLIMRGIGKDPLEHRLEPERESYWVEARPPRSRESYFSQF